MVDPGTAANAIAKASKVGTPLIQRVLGPTADLLGNELKDWADRRLNNVGRILENADRKLPPGVDADEGVAPRVLARVIAEGSFCEDPVSVEYLGGVMASSKSGISRDDRGATWAALIARMSTYELRTHYILYKAAHEELKGKAPDFAQAEDREAHGRFFMSYGTYAQGMDFTSEESPLDLLGHIFPRLEQQALIGDMWGTGPADWVSRYLDRRVPPEGGIAYAVTLPGIYLFSWAFGYSSGPLAAFVNPDADFEMDPPIPLLSCVRLRDLPLPPEVTPRN